MKKILFTILVAASLNAAVPEPDTAPPEPNYTAMMPLESEQNSTENMVGDNALNQGNIGGKIGYQSEVGESNLRKERDSTGAIRYFETDAEGNEVEITTFQSKESSDEYKERLTGFSLDAEGTDEEKALRQEKITEAKATTKAELISKGMTPRKMEDMFIEGVNVDARGTSFVNSRSLNSGSLEYEDGKEVADFYQNNYGAEQMINSVSNLNNAGRLKEAFDMMDDFKAELNSKYASRDISCFISRQLVPKYYCPMVGRTETLFGGDFNVSEANAIEECGNNCKKEIECVPYKVLDSLDVDIRINNPFPVYPGWNSETSFLTASDFSDKMQVKEISFEVKIEPSETWDGTEEEFEAFLEDTRPKFRFSLIKSSPATGNPPLLMIDRQILKLRGSYSVFTIPVTSTTENLVLKFYEPYITDNKAVAEYIDAPKWAKIGSIDIDNVKAEYRSMDMFFCPFAQLVNTEAECGGQGGEGLIQVNTGTQILNICTDSDHKIGPDRKLGGFYSQESCNQNCIEGQDCLPTYQHYSDFENEDIFKVEVACVDDPDNTACTVAKCEEFIRQDGLEDGVRPINEWVIYNDHHRKQTIANKILSTDVIRPKFDLDTELNASVPYDEMFQSEMKDHAFNYMLTNESYNRIEYRIGEQSPRKFSYKTQLINGVQTLALNLKPESNIIDDNSDYNLYVVMELDQLYKPVAGAFVIEGQSVQVDRDDTSGLQFRDKTYAIRTNASSNKWKTFKKVEFTNYKKVYDVKRCAADENGNGRTDEERPIHYWDDVIIPDNCIIERVNTWPFTPHLNIDRNAFYDSSADTFATYDANSEMAEVFVRQKFSSDIVENYYQVSDFIHKEIEEIPGGLIRNQESLNHDLSFKKIYNSEYGPTKMRGFVYNYKFYAFYDKNNLSYNEIIEKLVPENAFYEKVNPGAYRSSIDHDGEINNNIKPFILGSKEISTVNVEISPFLQEEGQRVFKFLFLHDDSSDVDPFANYQITGE